MNYTNHFARQLKSASCLSGLILIFASFLLPASAQLNLDPTFNGGVTEGKVQVFVSTAQPDGKILVGGGFSLANGVEKNTLTRLNADGSLDTGFNQGGIGPSGLVYDIVVLPDNKILIAGSFGAYNGIAKSGVARLNADGSLDTTFNAGGSGVSGIPHSISIQTDGKILLSGNISAYNGVAKFGVIRINADGALDTSFNAPFTTNQFVEEVEVLSSGKIIIAGSFNIGAPAQIDVARLNADGTLDTTFNQGGGGTDGGGVYALYIQSDGKILIGGGFQAYNGAARPRAARLNADGTLDASFVPVATQGIGIEYFDVQPDGKILAAGGVNIGNSTYGLIRYNADGSLDNSFTLGMTDNAGYHVRLLADGKILFSGFFNRFANQTRNNIVKLNSDGTVDNSFNASFVGFGYAAAMALQSDNKLVAVGNFNLANAVPRNNVVRFNTDGTVDSSFNVGTGTFSDSSNNLITAVAIQPDGKILIGGTFGGYNNVARRALARLNTDGSLDTGFNASYLATLATVSVSDILVLPDGKILIGGTFLTGPGAGQTILRLNSDGSRDTAFTNTANGTIQKLLRQPDGKILIAGNFTLYAGQARNRIARINEDGSLDTGFDPGSGANNTVLNFALQTDGKILISGAFTTFNGTTRNRVARLNTNGTLDASFNSAVGANGNVESVAVQADGRIFIVGRFSTYNDTVRNRLARLNPDGSLDPTFVSGFDSDNRFFARRILFQPDGKFFVSGLFKTYNGVPRNALVRINPAPTTPAGNGQIVFVSSRDGNFEIYKMNPDGTGQTRLTNNTASDSDPQWSADGTKIVFASNRDGNSEIYVMNADGTNQTRVTNNAFFDTEPSFSPDGTKIVFQGIRNNNRDIYVVNANGTGEVRLTTAAGFDILPRWSPNGAQLAFVSDRDGNFEIYSVNADGSNQTRLTNNAANEFSPDWSPDSSKLLFSSDRDGNVEIYAMNANGTNQTRLTNNAADDDTPAWSPDGLKITFSSTRDGNSEVYAMNADGTNQQRLTNIAGNDFPGDWQPRFVTRNVPFDFDGDGRADISVYRQPTGNWYVQRSTAGFLAQQFGVSSDKIAPADYDGDGKTDVAVFRPTGQGNPNQAYFYISNSSNGNFVPIQFGASGDEPMSGDWDGDGRADVAVYREGATAGAQSYFFYRPSSQPGADFVAIAWGAQGDVPAQGDFDGDGKLDAAVFRRSNATWYIQRSSNNQLMAMQFGVSSDKIVPADYDGDGKTDIAVYRDGIWYIQQSAAGFRAEQFGIAPTSDVPVPADYDGDGKADLGVYRFNQGNWYLMRSTQGFSAQQFGNNTDIAVPSAYLD